MASLFKSLSDDMERVAQVVEEGAKILMGTSSHMGEQEGDTATDSDLPGEDAIFDEDGMMHMEGGEEEYETPLMGMADSVLSDIMSYQVGPQTPMEHVQAFTAAITWSEPFIKCLVAFHILVVIITVSLAWKGGIYGRMGFMIVLGIIVRLAERLNDYGASHWKEFATQNYFDRKGIFTGMMLCAPLLFVCFCMLVSLIREASNLLVDVKQMKMKAKEKKKNSKDKSKGQKKKYN